MNKKSFRTELRSSISDRGKLAMLVLALILMGAVGYCHATGSFDQIHLPTAGWVGVYAVLFLLIMSLFGWLHFRLIGKRRISALRQG